jgi:hypothetical protein
VLSRNRAYVPVGQTAQQPAGTIPNVDQITVDDVTKTKGEAEHPATGFISLGLFFAITIGYVVWAYIVGGKKEVVKFGPNLKAIGVITGAVIIGLGLFKLVFNKMDALTSQSDFGIVQGLNKYLVHPLTNLVNFV